MTEVEATEPAPNGIAKVNSAEQAVDQAEPTAAAPNHRLDFEPGEQAGPETTETERA
jgi:hypothetical protein